MLEAIARVLEIRLEIKPSWRGGELARLADARHANLEDAIVRRLTGWPDWIVVPEVSFAIHGERGAIDLVAWNAGASALLAIEVKTQLVDVQALLGGVDRKRRVAPAVVRDRGWRAHCVGMWVAIADSPTNRRHVKEHAALLRAALPHGRRELREWLDSPRDDLRALTFFSYDHRWTSREGRGTGRRVRPRRIAGPGRGAGTVVHETPVPHSSTGRHAAVVGFRAPARPAALL